MIYSHREMDEEIGPRVSDGVVFLGPMSLDDVEPHLTGEDQPTVRWLSGGVSTRETVSAWITRNRESWRGGGPIRSFGIRDVSGELIGMVEANLDMQGVRAGVANISYGLYPRARGSGFATRAVLLICDYLRDSTPTDTALIQVDIDNEASARVPVRAGFRFVGRRVTPERTELLTFVRRLQIAFS